MAVADTIELRTELQFFEAHRLELMRDSAGKYALVKGTELLGIYDAELDALRAGFQQLGDEAFLVKHIVEADVPLNFSTFNLGF